MDARTTSENVMRCAREVARFISLGYVLRAKRGSFVGEKKKTKTKTRVFFFWEKLTIENNSTSRDFWGGKGTKGRLTRRGCQYLAMAFSGVRIGVRAEAAVGIALLNRYTHVSRYEGIPLVTGGALFAPASDVAARTVARGLPVRSEMARAREPVFPCNSAVLRARMSTKKSRRSTTGGHMDVNVT